MYISGFKLFYRFVKIDLWKNIIILVINVDPKHMHIYYKGLLKAKCRSILN